MGFGTLIGGAAILCYIFAIIFNNVGLAALALGATTYAIFGG